MATLTTTISLTQFQALSALRTFLLGALPLDPENVIKGQVNRVAEPVDEDFIVFWPIASPRLGTNVVTYADNQAVGSIAGTILTVTEVTRGTLAPGMLLVDEGGLLAVPTVIGLPLSGSATTGGTGTYAVSPSQTFVSGTVYGGVRKDLTPTDLTVQVDIHGPNATDYARIIESLFRSEYGTTAFANSGIDITPLYCSEIRQIPFINQEQQYEDRWTLDLHLQVNPVVGTPQQFADELDLTLIDAETAYPA